MSTDLAITIKTEVLLTEARLWRLCNGDRGPCVRCGYERVGHIFSLTRYTHGLGAEARWLSLKTEGDRCCHKFDTGEV